MTEQVKFTFVFTEEGFAVVQPDDWPENVEDASALQKMAAVCVAAGIQGMIDFTEAASSPKEAEEHLKLLSEKLGIEGTDVPESAVKH